MPNHRRHAVAAIAAAMSALAAPALLNTAEADAAPLPGFCLPPSVVDDVCTARLASVTADVVNGTITGTPIGGGTAITLAGQGDAYLQSTGFGDAPPAPVESWDAAIDSVSNLDVDASDPNWYGNAKAKVFLPRTLNDLATQFPPDILVVRFASDVTQPDSFRLISIQPTPL
jgi:hypothetical protein